MAHDLPGSGHIRGDQGAPACGTSSKVLGALAIIGGKADDMRLRENLRHILPISHHSTGPSCFPLEPGRAAGMAAGLSPRHGRRARQNGFGTPSRQQPHRCDELAHSLFPDHSRGQDHEGRSSGLGRGRNFPMSTPDPRIRAALPASTRPPETKVRDHRDFERWSSSSRRQGRT